MKYPAMEALRCTIENSFASITYEPSSACIVFAYKRFGTSEEFRNAWTVAAELGASKGTQRWLSNSLRMEVLRTEDQGWFIDVIAPTLQPDPLKKAYVAVIVSENAFAKLSVMNIARAISHKHPIVFKFFESEAKGLDWLRSLE
jgi:hypothetical protein